MISIDWTLILQFFNFIVLLFILNKILYRPLLNIMAKRQAEIEEGKTFAHDLEAEINEKMQRYQQQLSQAKTAATQERSVLRAAAHQQESAITGEAQQKAALRVQNMRKQVAQEAAAAGVILKNEASALANQIVAKVLGRTLA